MSDHVSTDGIQIKVPREVFGRLYGVTGSHFHDEKLTEAGEQNLVFGLCQPHSFAEDVVFILDVPTPYNWRDDPTLVDEDAEDHSDPDEYWWGREQQLPFSDMPDGPGEGRT